MAGGGRVQQGAIEVEVNSMLGRSICCALSLEPSQVGRLMVVGVDGSPDMVVHVSMVVRLTAAPAEHLRPRPQ
jgi:hypothetical protein